MSFEISIPELDRKPASTKDAVISALTSKWPLTLKGIFYFIRKRYGYSASYQAVFKAVKELSSKGVLTEKNRAYEIDISWIKRLQSFTDIVETNYYAKYKMESLSGIKDSKGAKDLMVLKFNSLFDAEKYLYYFLKNNLFHRRNETICMKTEFEWKSIYYLRAEYNLYKRLIDLGHKIYHLNRNQTQIEKSSLAFYRSIGVKIRKLRQAEPYDTLAFLDYYIQIYLPAELKKDIFSHLARFNSIALINALESSSDVRVLINKDKSITTEIKESIVKQFYGNRNTL